MFTIKRCFIFLVLPAIGMACFNCNNISKFNDAQPTEYKQPVVMPLIFSKGKKIGWDTIKAAVVNPEVTGLNFEKLPKRYYDTSGMKSLRYTVTETKFDYTALPQKDLDIDKLPSKPIKFSTVALPRPKTIKAGAAKLKSTSLSLFELGEAQGLIGSTVTALFNDKDGFLWVATEQGLYRYDGEFFLLYMPILNNRYIYSMVEDNLGRIWISLINAGGFEVFDPRAGTLKIAADVAGSNNYYNRVMLDSRKMIWISSTSAGGINIIDPEKETVKLLGTKNGLSDSTTKSIAEDKNHNIWIATFKGIDMIDFKNGKIISINKKLGLRSDSVQRLLVDHNGKLWIGFYGGCLSVLNIQKKSIQTIKELQRHNTDLIKIFEDEGGKIWFGTYNTGLLIMDPKSQTYRRIKTSDGLNDNQLEDITGDKQGQVWVAAVSGLNKFINNNVVIEHVGNAEVSILAEDNQGLVWDEITNNGIDIIDYKNKFIKHLSTRQGLTNDTTNQIKEINGRLFIGTNGGLDIIDSTKTIITKIGKAQGIDASISGLLTDKTGRIWLAAQDGVYVYDPNSGTVKHLGQAQGLFNGLVSDIQIDAQGYIWLITGLQGIYVIDPASWVIKHLNTNISGLNDTRNMVMMADKKGNVWIGTPNGIFIADMKHHILLSFSTPQGLIDERVATLLLHDQQIYASTVRGITIITPPLQGGLGDKKWSTRSFGNEYGLIKSNTGYCLTDAIGRNGIFFWGDKGVTILDISKKDPYIPPIYIKALNVMDQQQYFAGGAGKTSTGFRWEKVAGPFNMPVNLRAPYNKNYFQFQFGSLNLSNNDSTWYRYRLSGVDKTWSGQTVSTTSRNYFNLAPGQYTFQLTGRSVNGGWSKPVSLMFTINPPWWQTWWADIIYILLFTGTVYGIVYFRSRKLLQDNRILEHKVHIRTEEVMQQKEEIEAQRDSLEKAFNELKTAQAQLIQSEKMASLGELTAGIAHEIQNPLNFVNNFSEVNAELIDEMLEDIEKGNYQEVKEIATDIKANQQKINQHGKRADFIVKGMLQHSRTSKGERQFTNINILANEFLKLSYHGLRAKDSLFNVELVTNFDENAPKINVVEQDIGRVLLNLFNNAFYAVSKKTKIAGSDYKPSITVATSSNDSSVSIRVKDNGIGIPDAIKEKIMQPFFTTKPTGEGTGLGLSLSYDIIVKGYGGSISVDSKEGEFTEFKITLPLTR